MGRYNSGLCIYLVLLNCCSKKIRGGRNSLFVTPVIFLGGPYWSWRECWPAGRARWGHVDIAVPHPVAATQNTSAKAVKARDAVPVA